MYNYDWNPYAIDPSRYITQALEPMQGGQPQMAQAKPEQKYFGPAHEALSNYFTQSLGQQMAVPGLLGAMQNNPALAQQIGGLLGGSYTPPTYPTYHIDWKAAQDIANHMPQNFVGDAMSYKAGFEPAGTAVPAPAESAPSQVRVQPE